MHVSVSFFLHCHSLFHISSFLFPFSPLNKLLPFSWRRYKITHNGWQVVKQKKKKKRNPINIIHIKVNWDRFCTYNSKIMLKSIYWHSQISTIGDYRLALWLKFQQAIYCNSFLIFPWTQDLTFHANCLWCQILFSGKIKIKKNSLYQFVACWISQKCGKG